MKPPQYVVADFIVTAANKNLHPQAHCIPDDAKVFAINGKVAPRLHLISGNVYTFDVITEEVGELYFTTDCIGGGEDLGLPSGDPLVTISMSSGSSIIKLRVDANRLPRTFYYQSRSGSFRGGQIFIDN